MTVINSSGDEHDPMWDVLSDTELDAALVVADQELLEYIRCSAHTQTALLTMMASGSAAAAPAVSHYRQAAADRVAAIVELRAITRRLSDRLARIRSQCEAIVIALYAVGVATAAVPVPAEAAPDGQPSAIATVVVMPATFRLSRPGTARRWQLRRQVRRAARQATTALVAATQSLAVERLAGLARSRATAGGLPSPTGLDQVMDTIKDPVSYLASELDQVDAAVLAEEFTAIGDQVARLAAMACSQWPDTDLAALAVAFAGALECLGDGTAARLARVLPTVHCMAIELGNRTELDPGSQVSRRGVDYLRKIQYQLNYFSDTVVAARLDAEIIMSAIGSAIHQLPASLLADIEVDAAGADLSQISVDDLAGLEGIIWTLSTTWPHGLGPIVRARSRPLSLGRFQVEGGPEQDDLGLRHLVGAYQLPR